MKWTRTADTLEASERGIVGGKAYRLAELQRHGFRTAPWICVTTSAYDAYLNDTGLRERIAMELYRKAFEEMRWEELWDCATRIRHMFLTTPMPAALQAELSAAIENRVGGRAVAVRSSAVDEDNQSASFAGLHDSYVNVRGMGAIIRHVHLVWASLWSDAALLYRREISLDVSLSAMAVLVQELVAGRCSGVVFTVHPTQPQRAVIESVYGLNQGLVDGAIEPDRWTIRRESREILEHTPAQRRFYFVPDRQDIRKAPLPQSLSGRPPLSIPEVEAVAAAAFNVESAFGDPQDIEWTMDGGHLTLLQARPITTVAQSGSDQRGWYLSLHKSFDQLQALRRRIENDHIPDMIEAAEQLAGVELKGLSAAALAKEIRRRWELNQHWSAVYWEDFIPYAHGIRLFGQFYNDRVKPDDPYAFIDLLTRTEMQSLERNEQLQQLAQMVHDDPRVIHNISVTRDQTPFERKLDQFLEQFGDLSTGVTGARNADNDLRPLLDLLTEMAGRQPSDPAGRCRSMPAEQLKEAYLSHFENDEKPYAEAVLDLARSSYRLRDDDNIHLGRIEARLLEALEAGRRLLSALPPGEEKAALARVIAQVNPDAAVPAANASSPKRRLQFRQRQLVGQPAGPGLIKATARVITAPEQLMQFKAGDVLVCDAVDPNMTFVVPLAAAIVERRGGMLIHGAIIAREYGLPCITGVPAATSLIRTGDTITVDGYLGIITLSY